MSEVRPLMRSGLMVALKAIFVPSGDQSNPPTVKSWPLVRRRPGLGRAEGLGDVNRPEMAMRVFAPDDVVVAVTLLAVLGGLGDSGRPP